MADPREVRVVSAAFRAWNDTTAAPRRCFSLRVYLDESGKVWTEVQDSKIIGVHPVYPDSEEERRLWELLAEATNQVYAGWPR